MKLRAVCDSVLSWLFGLSLLALVGLGVRLLFQLLPRLYAGLVVAAHQVLLLLLLLLLRFIARSATFGASGFLGKRLIEFNLSRYARR